MRVVVTGGCGFIGSCVVDRLASRGDDVRVVDVAARAIDGATVYPVSVLEEDALAHALRGADAVVHLAGFVRERMHREPDAGTRLQIEGTRNVLEASARCGVTRVVLASSFYVYAGSAGAIVDEDAPIDASCLEPFGRGKLASERLCRDYAARGQLTYTVLRIGSAYGPGGSNAVRAFLEAGFRGEPIEVWGDGRRRNQFTYVGDLADGTDAILRRLEASRDQVFNLISPAVTTTGDLAAALAAEFGFAITFRTDRLDGPSFPYMRSDKASDLLGWRALPLAEGLRVTARDLRAPVLR
ncbi:MAG TPA: NAD(P)-dependent oxidoreductase [Candidatus Limnocylindria bacterium]|jgi:UDP-glucose 4-epimerase|nr:NAD(P)-dependent oxidoreductase [Candidatus Limnocylindria bacterium]